MARIDHIAIAVRSLEEGLASWGTLLGKSEADGIEEVASEKVKVAFLNCGESRIELLEPTSPESAIAKFIEKRGPGINHICLRVDDIASEIARLRSAGFEFVGAAPRPGADDCLVAFIHPKSAGGVLVELSQHPSH